MIWDIGLRQKSWFWGLGFVGLGFKKPKRRKTKCQRLKTDLQNKVHNMLLLSLQISDSAHGPTCAAIVDPQNRALLRF